MSSFQQSAAAVIDERLNLVALLIEIGATPRAGQDSRNWPIAGDRPQKKNAHSVA